MAHATRPVDRVVFFGTPRFAVPALAALCESGRRPVRVITQPARPAGRGGAMREPPVSRWARQQGLQVEQPERVREAEFLEALAALRPDVAVVVAFGQIFPRQLLELPPSGCINLHASLLPRHRGAAPVQAALIAGDRVTGVTTMLMEEGLDSGPILLQQEVAVGEEENAGELADRLAEVGAGLMVRTLEQLGAGRLEPRPQRHEEATDAPRLQKSDGRIDWNLDARSLFNRLRGLTPWPGLFCRLRERDLKVLWGSPLEPPPDGPRGCGRYLGLIGEGLAIRCGEGTAFAVERLQRPGRTALSAGQFLHGEPLEIGELFR